MTAKSTTALSILDQTAERRYTRLLYTFPLPETMEKPLTHAIEQRFEVAVKAVLAKWPTLQCHARLKRLRYPTGPIELIEPPPLDEYLLETQANTNRRFLCGGVMSVRGIHQWNRSLGPVYEHLAARGMPPSKLHAEDYCHLSDELDLANPDGCPVYHVGLNFIQGGLILCISYTNCILDDYAHALIFTELARMMRDPQGLPHPDVESSASYTRKNIDFIDALKTCAVGRCVRSDWWTCPEFSEESLRNGGQAHRPLPTRIAPDLLSSRIFSFPATIVRQLRACISDLSKAYGKEIPPPFTELDTIMAVVWCAVIRARHPYDYTIHAEFESKLGIKVDGRTYMHLPYPGVHARNAAFSGVIALTSTHFLHQIPREAPLDSLLSAVLAMKTQVQLDDDFVYKRLRYMVGLNDAPGNLKPSFNAAGEHDVTFSQIVDCGGDDDFGSIPYRSKYVTLGKPQFVRKLDSPSANGDCTLLPIRARDARESEDRPFEVHVRLRRDQMERARDELMKYADKCWQ